LSRRIEWSTGSPDGSRTRIRQHSVSPPSAVDDVRAQVRPVVATGHVEVRLLPT
jgi:hypothetical protein